MSDNDDKMILLKNGVTEFRPLVAATMMSLRGLLERDPIAFYELVMKVRDPSHKVFSGHQVQVLKDLSLMDAEGGIHSTISNIVQSAVTGDGFNMVLTSPVMLPGTEKVPGG